MHNPVREFIRKRQVESAKRELEGAMHAHEEQGGMLATMLENESLTSAEWEAHTKKLDEMLERKLRRYQTLDLGDFRVIDVFWVRVALDWIAFVAIYTALLYVVHPMWTETHVEEVLIVGLAGGLGTSYLRNTWKARS